MQKRRPGVGIDDGKGQRTRDVPKAGGYGRGADISRDKVSGYDCSYRSIAAGEGGLRQSSHVHSGDVGEVCQDLDGNSQSVSVDIARRSGNGQGQKCAWICDDGIGTSDGVDCNLQIRFNTGINSEFIENAVEVRIPAAVPFRLPEVVISIRHTGEWSSFGNRRDLASAD